MILSFALIVILVPPLRANIAAGYPGDSFWTLDWGGRAGVVAISVTGLALLFAVLGAKSRRLPPLPLIPALARDILLGLVIYAVVYSLSPQVFYTFYRMIFPDLPGQIVINSAFNLSRIMPAIDFRDTGNLSDDLAGVGFWAVIPFALWRRWRG